MLRLYPVLNDTTGTRKPIFNQHITMTDSLFRKLHLRRHDTCISVTASLCRTPEINTTLLNQGYSSIKQKV